MQIYSEIFTHFPFEMSFHTDMYCQMLISAPEQMLSIYHIHQQEDICRIYYILLLIFVF